MHDLFPPTTGPRLFATPLGVDFCAALIAGLDRLLADHPPEAIARVHLYVANARMERRLRSLYAQRGAGFLPRIRPVMALGEDADIAGIPAAISPLRLRLDLVRLIGALLDHTPELAPRSALYDLADSLAELMSEMFEEGVSPTNVAALDVAEHAEHWQRAQSFLKIVTHFMADEAALTQAARQTRIVAALAARWRDDPPSHPVIVAGSTGSRGATAQLMTAVAGLPQGAVILPGLDRAMPAAIWAQLLQDRHAGLEGEDHPQYRIAKFAHRLGLDPHAIPDWPTASRPMGSRDALVSLALRPAPVTDQWLREGPALRDVGPAMAGVTLLEAPNPQAEAMAIALRLRQAVAEGRRAAVISPDRVLTRQITAALARWGIRPDDSAGQPLSLAAPGRFLRHVAALEVRAPDPESLAIILKHPLCHTGLDRGDHLVRSRDLEVQLLRRTPGMPPRAALFAWAEKRVKDPGAIAWVGWLADHIMAPPAPGPIPFADRVARHIARANALAAGPGQEGSGELYHEAAGEAAAALMNDLQAEAAHAGAISAMDYRDLFDGLTRDRDVRQPLFPHADVLIWGTQEARVQGADLLICAGLNDGIWPPAPTADPWLNRALRAAVGLRLPDRVIGLSAHDFQQAICAPEVWLTRAARNAETDTIPSRWLNRLINLMEGANDETRAALKQMRDRGDASLALAEAFVTPPQTIPFAPRPAPAPPAASRPKRLALTEVEKLIRDPYAIYATHVLGLRALDPLRSDPDARLRGTILHKVLELFLKETLDGLPPADDALALLLSLTDRVLDEEAPFPAVRRMWRARMARAARFFLETEIIRRQRGAPLAPEAKSEWPVPGTGVTLIGRADRIDRMADGRFALYDYKTGAPPTQEQQEYFNKQLWIEALMVAAGCFGLPKGSVAGHIAYVGLGTKPEIVAHDPTPDQLSDIAARLAKRLGHMQDPAWGFSARRAVTNTRIKGDFDQLARYGEWDETDAPQIIPVGQGGAA
ncbi:double-strand break repair protein AddB [Rhodobacterales bacterium LSUCC0031]|nr:double-strand break repair protein AddB [Rhodobacterales bacterium LSUCC0031]